MSLYQLQKFLYDLNREPRLQQQFRTGMSDVLDQYELTSVERTAVESHDIGLIYVLGANGQLLMHYAAYLGRTWPEYIALMREGIVKYGPVRAGIYAMTTLLDDRRAGL
jgi:hypothetical protein